MVSLVTGSNSKAMKGGDNRFIGWRMAEDVLLNFFQILKVGRISRLSFTRCHRLIRVTIQNRVCLDHIHPMIFISIESLWTQCLSNVPVIDRTQSDTYKAKDSVRREEVCSAFKNTKIVFDARPWLGSL